VPACGDCRPGVESPGCLRAVRRSRQMLAGLGERVGLAHHRGVTDPSPDRHGAAAPANRGEAAARCVCEPDRVPADVAVDYLREIGTTWRMADGGPGRRMLADALFQRIEAARPREITLRLTDAPIAHGLGPAMPARPGL